MGDPPPNRPAPAANGTLEKTPLIHLLLYALQNGLTGTLEVWAPDQRRAGVLFLSGQPAKAYTSEPICYLGAVLRDLGYLSEDDLARSLEELARAKAAGSALHGQVLLAARTIDDTMLEAGLRAQLAQKLRHLAAFPPQGAYAYYDLFDGLRGWGPEASQGFDPVPMIWGMLCENTPLSHLDVALAAVMALPVRLAGAANIARLDLSPTHNAIVGSLRAKPMRVAELIARSGLPEPEARRLVYLLLVTRQVDVMRSAETPAPARAEESASPSPKSATESPRPSSTAPAPRQTTPSRPAAAQATRSGSGPVPAGAAPQAPLSPELKKRREEIVQRAASIDRSDYFTMLDVPRDAKREDIEAAFYALAKLWHPDRLPSELAAVRDDCSRVFSRMSEAHATLIDAQKRENYSLLLADGSGSPETQAKVAKVLDAATAFQKAEVCLRRGDHAQAEALCRSAVEADATQSDYLAMLAWLLALKPENQSPEKTAESLTMLTKAIKLNARCEKAYFWRGMLLRRLGKAEAAMRDFRHAVDLNPRNIDAAREVRLYRMRGGRLSSGAPPMKGESGVPPRRSSPLPAKPDDNKAGLLNRFFKKS